MTSIISASDLLIFWLWFSQSLTWSTLRDVSHRTSRHSGAKFSALSFCLQLALLFSPAVGCALMPAVGCALMPAVGCALLLPVVGFALSVFLITDPSRPVLLVVLVPVLLPFCSSPLTSLAVVRSLFSDSESLRGYDLWELWSSGFRHSASFHADS